MNRGVDFPFGIGSDMELVTDNFLHDRPAPPPWEIDGPVSYVETGRQALAFVGQQLWDDGFRTLLLPSFFCDSMLAPFLTNAWSVVPVKVDADLNLDLTDLENKASQQSGPFVALTVLYFGRCPDERYRAAVKTVQERGGIVVDDETHRVFNPGEAGADIAVASLRKLLPVADGAYVRGLYANRIAELALSVSGHRRWDAMALKTDHLLGRKSSRAVRELFSDANGELEQFERIFKPSSQTLLAVRSFDYEKLAKARRENALALQDEIVHIRDLHVLNPTQSETVPSHVVVRGVPPVATQARMAGKGLFCPIHWQKSAILRSDEPWPHLGLSVPVDHRYDTKDMAQVAQIIRETWA